MRYFVCVILCLVQLCVGFSIIDGPNDNVVEGEDIFPALPIVALWSDNERCRNDSRMLLDNLRNSTTWAMQMLDASAKSVVGVLAGSVYQMGDFDECVSTVVPIRAQYCLATVTVKRKTAEKIDLNADIYNPTVSAWNKISYIGDPTKIRRDAVHMALCVPASCSHDDIQASLNRHLAASVGNSTMTSTSVVVNAALCQTNRQEDTMFTTGTIAYLSVIGAIVLIVLISTVYDFAYCNESDARDGESSWNNQSKSVGYLLCFSLRKNFPEIALPESTNHSLDCIYGMRFLSICLITVDHRIGASIAGPIQNYEFIERQYKRFYSIIFYQGDVLVDTFFVISGLLVTYILLLTLNKRKVNPFLAIVLRYIRLTPVYMVVVFFYVTLLYRMGDGPLWDAVVGIERDACQKTWWVNMLYINNYVQDENMCMIQSWYLPCDTHFFIIALFVVSIMHKHPKTGCSILAVLTVVSVVIPFVITYVGQLPPLLYFYSDFLISPRTHELFRIMYTKSHNRASPYFVGMATGYFLYRTRHLKKNYTWRTSVVMLAAVILCLGSLLPASVFYDYTWDYNVTQAALFAGLHRFTWAVGICLFMLSIIFSKTSVIRCVLSMTPMISLSKLVYSQYLVHMAIQTVHAASVRSPQHISVNNIASSALADIVWSLLISLCLYVTVEAPIRLIFKRIMESEKKEKDVHEPEDLSHEFKYTQKICIGV